MENPFLHFKTIGFDIDVSLKKKGDLYTETFIVRF